YPVGNRLQCCNADRTLFAGLLKPGQNFGAFKGLTAAVFLDQHRKYLVHTLIRGKATLTTQAFPAAANRFALLRHAGVYNLVFKATTKRASHLVEFLCFSPTHQTKLARPEGLMII